MTFIFRTIKFALQGFFRNIWLSVVTIIILALTIFSVTMLFGINLIADRAIEAVKDKVDVSVYFKPEAEEEKVLSLSYRLQELPQVDEVVFVSPEEALEKFLEIHKDESFITESIEELEGNPLGVTLIVKASNIENYPEILTFLENPEYDQLIADKNFDDNEKVISQLSNISKKVEKYGWIISIIFIVIAVLIVFNTIRINIYTHREEIGIMKLVGATNWFVRAPFVVETMLYALLAVVICLAALYPLLGVIAPQVDNFFEGYNLGLADYFNANFWKIFGYQLVFAAFLSILSSSIAIGRYLKV